MYELSLPIFSCIFFHFVSLEWSDVVENVPMMEELVIQGEKGLGHEYKKEKSASSLQQEDEKPSAEESKQEDADDAGSFFKFCRKLCSI